MNIVITDVKAREYSSGDLMRGLIRMIRYTPAVTKVEE